MPVAAPGVLRDKAGIASFATAIRGAVLRPGNARYDDARKVWNGLIDRRPALIVHCAGTGDVVACVNFARDQGLPLAVRGGGHNVAGSAVCDDGLVVDLSEMKGIKIDCKSRTANAEPGLLSGEFDSQTPSVHPADCRSSPALQE